jgi:inner membrane protein
VYQKQQVENELLTLAESRGHQAKKVLVHPSIGNLLVWRTLYESGGKYYVQAVRVSPISESQIYEGGSIKAYYPKAELNNLSPESVLSNDIKRFSKFAKGYLVVLPEYPDMIGDLRMGILPNSLMPLWGIKIDPQNQDDHVSMENYDRSLNNAKIQKFIAMLLGNNPD